MSEREPDFFSVGMVDTAKRRSYEPDRQEVRAELLETLATAQAARDECPWNERTFLYHKVVFPQMANWLPAEERDRLRALFAREVARIETLLAA